MTEKKQKREMMQWLVGIPAALLMHYAGYRLMAVWLEPAMGWGASLAWGAGIVLFLWALAKSTWTMRIGLVVSVTCLAFFLKGVDFRAMGRAFLQIRPAWLIPALLMGFGLYSVKTYRWQILLRPIKPLGFWRLFRASLMGFMANCILPARIGEIVRGGVVAMKRDVRAAPVFATILVERVFDLFGVVFYFLLSLVLLREKLADPGHAEIVSALRVAGYSFAGVVGAAIVFLILLRLHPQRIISVSDRLTRWCVAVGLAAARGVLSITRSGFRARVMGKLEKVGMILDERLVHLLQEFVEGLRVVHGVLQMLWLILLSLIHWGFAILIIYCTAKCFPSIELSVTGSALVFVITALAVALPQAPGFLGVFHVATEAGCRLLMSRSAYLVVAPTLKSFTMILWFMNVVPVVVGGLICLWYEGMTLGDLRKQGVQATHAAEETGSDSMGARPAPAPDTEAAESN